MAAKRRALTDQQIRAMAYKVTANELMAATEVSSYWSDFCRMCGGSAHDVAALKRQMIRIAERLRQRGKEIQTTIDEGD